MRICLPSPRRQKKRKGSATLVGRSENQRGRNDYCKTGEHQSLVINKCRRTTKLKCSTKIWKLSRNVSRTLTKLLIKGLNYWFIWFELLSSLFFAWMQPVSFFRIVWMSQMQIFFKWQVFCIKYSVYVTFVKVTSLCQSCHMLSNFYITESEFKEWSNNGFYQCQCLQFKAFKHSTFVLSWMTDNLYQPDTNAGLPLCCIVSKLTP